MTGLLGKEHIQALAREDSVRGVLVRRVLKKAEEADTEEILLLEKALSLLLERFQAMPGDAS